MNICFLVSGNGGNFKFFALAKSLGFIKDVNFFVLANDSCNALKFAEKNKFYAKKINYKENNKELLDELIIIQPDAIVSAWNIIIDKEVVRHYSGKLINLHYSLLPSFAGVFGTTPIKQAYERNCKFIGSTCHYIDEGVDTGLIISQLILKNNKPFNQTIQLVFQQSCLLLLNSIALTFNKNIIDEKQNDSFQFSPNLCFDDKVYDLSFWNELSSL